MFRSLIPPEAPVRQQPACFRDLNLDQILDPIVKRETYTDLAPWFYTLLPDSGQIRRRQQIQQDLLQGDGLQRLDRFSAAVCALAENMEKHQADLKSGDPWRCNYLLFGRILGDSEQYVKAVTELADWEPGFQSRDLQQAMEDLRAYCRTPEFQNFQQRQRSLRQKFDGAGYCMQIRYETVRVKKYEGEANLSQQILEAFQKFRQEDSRDYRQQLKEEPYADHVEAAILRCLEKLYPDLFAELTDYAKTFAAFVDPGLHQLCRELRFYVDWLESLQNLQNAGLPFCFPGLEPGRTWCREGYDLSLALKIGSRVVKNDFCLEKGEAFLVVTGPNQGGKTTFARAVGQLHYLASLGLMVPGSGANLPPADRVLTHFEREDTDGRLQDDLLRLRDMLQSATDRSLLIVNEIFASTAAQDASALGKRMLEAMEKIGCRAVVVTFLSELAGFGSRTVSMVSQVASEDSDVRTFRVVRKPPDDLTYAMTLVKKHHLTYEQIWESIS